MPVMAIGTSSGTIYLQNVSTLQVKLYEVALLVHRITDGCEQPQQRKGMDRLPFT